MKYSDEDIIVMALFSTSVFLAVSALLALLFPIV